LFLAPFQGGKKFGERKGIKIENTFVWEIIQKFLEGSQKKIWLKNYEEKSRRRTCKKSYTEKVLKKAKTTTRDREEACFATW